MLGISFYEFLVVLICSLIFLRPSDIVSFIKTLKGINFAVKDTISYIHDQVEKSVILEEINIDGLYSVKKDIETPNNEEDSHIENKKS